MVLVMTLPFAGIVGLSALLQASDGGWRYFAAAVAMMAAALAAPAFLHEGWQQNGQIAFLVGSGFNAGALVLAGAVIGLIGKRFSTAGKVGGVAFLVGIATLWTWTWMSILT
ncbi:hypothetical protein [Leisingera sp. S232]|uniref:hypothetical protein n=1 Tax=Leisingera sp. S232 TaxID=3415132 RepID=UPI0008693439|nr:hypothetical protein AB838_17370 [Rhodobacteraceae bacterium (ex Bugula neritina AB1)]